MGGLIKGDIFCENKIGSFLDDGYNGTVYRYDCDKVLKIQECPGSVYQYEVVSAIKNLHLPNFYRIYDVLFTEKCGLRTFKGTISQYYPLVDINLWTERSEYVVDGFSGLFDSALTLSSNKILINDIHLENVLLSSCGMVAIDADDYIRDFSASEEELTKENLRILKENIFSGLLLSHYMRYLIDERRLGHIVDVDRSDALRLIEQLVNLDNSKDKDTFCKTLSKYKYPIDYFRRR